MDWRTALLARGWPPLTDGDTMAFAVRIGLLDTKTTNLQYVTGMDKNALTVSELFKGQSVTDEEVNAAVDAVLADLTIEVYPLADGYALDLNAAIKASTFAYLVRKDAHANQRQKHHAVRTAILLARPMKGKTMTEADQLSITMLPIGLLIRNKRRELGLSQDDLARQLGIPQSSISKLERGLGGDQHAPRILAALGAQISNTAQNTSAHV